MKFTFTLFNDIHQTSSELETDLHNACSPQAYLTTTEKLAQAFAVLCPESAQGCRCGGLSGPQTCIIVETVWLGEIEVLPFRKTYPDLYAGA